MGARAPMLLEEMRRRGAVEPTAVSYNSAIHACARAGAWARAVGLLDEMARHGVEPNERSYASAIDACAKVGAWERAVGLLETMARRGVEPGERSYTSAVDACAKGGEWERALEMVGRMGRRGVAPTLTTYGAALSACARAAQPERALSLFASLERAGLAPSRDCWGILLDAVRDRERARRLMRRMVAQGHLAGAEQTVGDAPALDLHAVTSEGAAEAAVRWWLDERLPGRLAAGELAAPRRVVLVTGYGKSREPGQTGSLKRRALAVASELGTVVEQPNPGRVVVEWPLEAPRGAL